MDEIWRIYMYQLLSSQRVLKPCKYGRAADSELGINNEDLSCRSTLNYTAVWQTTHIIESDIIRQG
jgi:hypothetical protein